MISYGQSMIEAPAGAETPPRHGPKGRNPMDETKDTRRREVLDYEERVEIWSRIAAARRTCRDCGGLGRFWWGAQDHGECGACRGTGRV